MDRAPSFGLPFFYRVVLPGAIMTAFISPLLFRVIDAVPRLGPYEGQILLSSVLVLGFLLSISGDLIYELYEGRRWPRPIARWRTRRWKEHVSRVLARAQDPAGPDYDELWAELRQFPVTVGDDGISRPSATAPTKMGNVLASYEQYPQLRYGMESVFYWERLWLALDKDVRNEVDSAWAPTDTLLYASAGLLFGSAVYVGMVLVTLFLSLIEVVQFEVLRLGRDLAIVLLGVALSFLFYSWSIPGHLTNGEAFKSAFDLYRFKLDSVRGAAAEESEKWERVREELQYGDYGAKVE